MEKLHCPQGSEDCLTRREAVLVVRDPIGCFSYSQMALVTGYGFAARAARNEDGGEEVGRGLRGCSYDRKNGGCTGIPIITHVSAGPRLAGYKY